MWHLTFTKSVKCNIGRFINKSVFLNPKSQKQHLTINNFQTSRRLMKPAPETMATWLDALVVSGIAFDSWCPGACSRVLGSN
jgi:hypothetical protein